jgi:hypothetical protein
VAAGYLHRGGETDDSGADHNDIPGWRRHG